MPAHTVHSPSRWLRIRVFYVLTALQIVLIIGVFSGSRLLYGTYRSGLMRQDRLRDYGRRLDSVSIRIDTLLTTGDQGPVFAAECADIADTAGWIARGWPSDLTGDSEERLTGLLDAAQVRADAAALAVATGPQEKSSGAEREIAAAERLRSSVRRLRTETDHLESREIEELRNAHGSSLWIDVLEAASLIPLLAVVVLVGWQQREMRLQDAVREEMEGELRRERNRLEKHVEERTEELQREVKERTRAEQLNRGRNQVLEMLVRNEPAEKILGRLAETVANYRSIWSCAVHLQEGDTLRLAAEYRLPGKLTARVQKLPRSLTDAPEGAALAQGRLVIEEDLSTARTPWSELLRANNIQSVWSAPFSPPGEPAMGTVTIYALLQMAPCPADIELLEMSCQMAALILERHQMNEQLIHQAFHDMLTGLANRRLGRDRLAGAIQRARRSGSMVAVLWIDLDEFKQVNDVHGHAAGDYVLQETARRLTARVRSSDTVARMGGDEFMILLEDVAARRSAEEMAADFLRLLERPIRRGELQFAITASVGISFYPDDGDTADALKQHADMAMYEAKFGGHGVCCYSSVLSEERAERKAIETEMIRALKEGGFELVYQPQCLPDGRLAGFEALLRFCHPQFGYVPPSRFVSIAEEAQLILPLGSWVLREVCRQIHEWDGLGCPAVPVAVNISAMQFSGEDFSAEVARVLAETGVAPSLLELELTESTVMKDFAESARQMRKLKALGVRLSIDDFGTGYSSLNYLHRLPIDALKIDRSFIEKIDEPDGTLPIVEAVLSMARTLGLRVVGEGVETAAQREALTGRGCDLLQGYLFSPGVPPAEAARYLLEGRLIPNPGAAPTVRDRLEVESLAK